MTAAAVGCGGGSNTGTGGSGGQATTSSTTSSTTSTTTSSTTSTTSGGMMCPPGMGTAFALTSLDFGEGSSGEWKKVGFNIDGKVSDGTSTDVCKPNSMGDPNTAYPDGDNGIDNSFGKNLLPTILSLYPTWVTDINTSLQNGDFNVLMKLYCLPPMGDAPMITTKLFGATALGSKPKLDGTDMWPVAPELLSDPKDPESSTISFPMSSVTGMLYDSGTNQTFVLSIPINSQTASTSIKLTLYAAHVTMNLSADRKTVTGGIVGGVLNTEEFVAEVKKVGYLLNLCNTSLFNGLITQVRQASDILSDGTQDPTKTCDGISMGLTFAMTEAQLGGVGPAKMVGMACQ